MTETATTDTAAIKRLLIEEAAALGFSQVGVAGIGLAQDEQHLDRWLAQGRHGEMGYMARHGTMRARPAELHAGTRRVISVRMDYWPPASRDPGEVLGARGLGYVSRYALGRDYHKLMRKQLAKLADRLAAVAGPIGHRVFVDSAPVLEKALARDAGLGWIGKHTNLIGRDAGSWFFLGEIFTSLELPIDAPATAHCGTCSRCIPACPTGAITAPYQLDARRCISYLTIELEGPIPEDLRAPMGNRIYGCDDCQLVCPWNKFAQDAHHPDFRARHALDAPRLADLFAWTAEDFDARMRGSAIYRIGHERWLRNIAVALGNGPASAEVLAALNSRAVHPATLVREHVAWALSRLSATSSAPAPRA